MSEAAEDSKLMMIENEGALFRGPSRSFPTEVWNVKRGAFEPYSGETPKPIEWGNEIDEDEAKALMAADDASKESQSGAAGGTDGADAEGLRA